MFKSYIKKTVGERKGNNQPVENIDGWGDTEEKNNNNCDTDSYFPQYSDDDSNDAGGCEKKRKVENAILTERRFKKVCDTWFYDKTLEVDSNDH